MLRAVKEKLALATHSLFCPCQVYKTKKQKSIKIIPFNQFAPVRINLITFIYTDIRKSHVAWGLKKGAAGGNCHLLITHLWENRSSCFPMHLYYLIILYYRLRVEGFFLKSCHRTSHTPHFWEHSSPSYTQLNTFLLQLSPTLYSSVLHKLHTTCLFPSHTQSTATSHPFPKASSWPGTGHQTFFFVDQCQAKTAMLPTLPHTRLYTCTPDSAAGVGWWCGKHPKTNFQPVL